MCISACFLQSISIFGDKCIGIAYVKNQLVVNCITRGLIIMDIYGKVAQILKSIAGNMQICTLDDKTIALSITAADVTG
jgi:hypothetical protein